MLRSLTALLLGTLCLSNTAFSANYPIDVLYNMTGNNKASNHAAWRGAELAASQLQAQHIPVSLMLYDGQSKPSMQHAITSMRAKQTQTPIMIGLTQADHVVAVASPLVQARHIFVGLGAASESLRERLGNHYFTPSATLEQEAKRGAHFLRHKLQHTHAIVIASSRPSDQTLAHTFSNTFSGQGGTLRHVHFPGSLTALQHTQLVNQLQQHLANHGNAAIYVATPAHDAVSLVKSLRSRGIGNTIMTASPLSTHHITTLKDHHASPLYYPSQGFFHGNHPNQRLSEFKHAYQARYHQDPTPEAALSYDAVMLVGYAIAHSKNYSQAALVEALQNIKEAPMVTGRITLASNQPVDHIAVVGVKDDLSVYEASALKERA